MNRIVHISIPFALLKSRLLSTNFYYFFLLRSVHNKAKLYYYGFIDSLESDIVFRCTLKFSNTNNIANK